MNEAIVNATTLALEKYPFTNGQCASFSAYLSEQLTRLKIENYVALGSLSCNGIKTFQYSGPIPRNPAKSYVSNWNGHAWICLLHENLILDATICRSAKSAPQQSKIRQHFTQIEILNKGAIICSVEVAQSDFGLKYNKKSKLHLDCYESLIGGLDFLHQKQRSTEGEGA